MHLIQQISNLAPLSDEAVAWLEEHIEVFEFRKNEFILRNGQVCTYLYYINKGLAGGFYFHEGLEVCNWIAAENDFATSYYSFISRNQSYEAVQCFEDTTAEGISYNTLNALYEKFPETERIGRLILEDYYMRAEERLLSIQFKSARERYDFLFEKRPHIILRAPLGKIATYLGMKQETLSRIRAEK